MSFNIKSVYIENLIKKSLKDSSKNNESLSIIKYINENNYLVKYEIEGYYSLLPGIIHNLKIDYLQILDFYYRKNYISDKNVIIDIKDVKLKSYQSEDLKKYLKSLLTYRHLGLFLYTGYGKTILSLVILYFISKLKLLDDPDYEDIFIITNKKVIKNQWINSIQKYIDIQNTNIIVCSSVYYYNNYIKPEYNLKHKRKIKFMIIDEIHTSTMNIIKILNYTKCLYFIGLTATPDNIQSYENESDNSLIGLLIKQLIFFNIFENLQPDIKIIYNISYFKSGITTEMLSVKNFKKYSKGKFIALKGKDWTEYIRLLNRNENFFDKILTTTYKCVQDKNKVKKFNDKNILILVKRIELIDKLYNILSKTYICYKNSNFDNKSLKNSIIIGTEKMFGEGLNIKIFAIIYTLNEIKITQIIGRIRDPLKCIYDVVDLSNSLSMDHLNSRLIDLEYLSKQNLIKINL